MTTVTSIRERLKPCNSWSPHEPLQKRRNKGYVNIPVQCNRPKGHDGNHMLLAGSFERLAEWGPAEVIK